MNEKEQYGIDILPIQLQMGEDSFLDGVNLSTDEFYRRLKDSSQFPKTSLPSLEEAQKLVDFYTSQGDESMEVVIEKLNQLLPRIVIAAMPETLDYLLAGGRLSKSSWMMGKLLSIIPIITFINGRVEVLQKKRGMKQCMRTVVDMIQSDQAEKEYGIIAAYTYNKGNVDNMIQMLLDEYQDAISVYDDLCSSIACHWGPNAFGFIYVKGEGK